MKNKYIYFFILIGLFFSLVTLTNADTKRGYVYCPDDDEPLNVRDAVGGNIVTALSCNTEVKVLSTNEGNYNNCSFYKISYGDGLVGYTCGSYIKTIEEIKKSGSDNIYLKENYSEPVSGDGTVACYEDVGDLSLRSSAGGSSTGVKLSCGDVVKINSVSESSGTCNYYYNVTNSDGNSGYVCGYYINTTKLSDTAKKYYEETENLEDFYKILKENGFDNESYYPYLAEIHARHPNWIFVAEHINLDFDTVVENENYYGRSLLEYGAFSENYFSMGVNTYDILSDTFYDYPTEYGWYDASSEAVAFYLDPRNYLNEKYIFAFEGLDYNENHDVEIIKKVLSGQTFWPTVYEGYEGNIYEDILEATSDVGINAVHIASRISQEISGIGIDDPRLGGTFMYNDVEYSKYYNFYNISVYGDNKIVNGMVYAMNHGWDSPFDAVYGGAAFIANGYIAVNQDTMYYEKFDVSTNNGHYDHQYMQNLAVVFQETDKSYRSYVNNFSEYFDTEIVFTIPVYENMSTYAVTSPSVGNPNNFLKDITINNESINNFEYNEFSYDITVPANTTTIDINAIPINSNAYVSGEGKIEIIEDETIITLVVTSESGRSRNYIINITREKIEEEIELKELSYILDNSGIKYNDNYMYGIKEETDIKSIINNVVEISPYASATIKEKDGKNKTSGIFKTGDLITFSNGKDSVTLTVLIYGDITGDGVIDKLDYLAVLRHFYGYITLEGVYKEAADARRDEEINKLDYLAILRDYYEYASIEQ